MPRLALIGLFKKHSHVTWDYRDSPRDLPFWFLSRVVGQGQGSQLTYEVGLDTRYSFLANPYTNN
jgi:hypothetical protein